MKTKKLNKVIVHVDMDAFFTSVEQLDEPLYRGKPVVVGSDPKKGKGRGVVSAASYEARKYGIHSAMPISIAYKKLPGAIFLRPRMYRYIEISKKIMRIFDSFSPLIEPLSIDEAFLDCTGTEELFGSPTELGKLIKQTIKKETGLNASVGIATNKSIAKIASDLDKPNGLTICPPGQEKLFLSLLPISAIWGVGKKTLEKLHNINCFTVKDVASLEPKILSNLLGKSGLHIWELANGIDTREVTPGRIQKSISEEFTFSQDENSEDVILKTIFHLSEKVSRRVKKENFLFKTISLKIRLEGFQTYTRSFTINDPTNSMYIIREIINKLYKKFDRGNQRVRLLGVKVENLISENQETKQLDLFNIDTDFAKREKEKKIEGIINKMRDEFNGQIFRASLLPENKNK